MAESHTKGEQKHYTHIVPADPGGRSAMTRASDGREPVYYDPARGRQEPPAVTAARDRHQALSAQIALRDALIMPDPEPPWEWYRELRDD